MTNDITILSILTGTLSVLVGFLLLFLQFYPQRKRHSIQQLNLKLFDLNRKNEDDQKKVKKIKEIMEKIEKSDKITITLDINRINFYVFIYCILVLIFSFFNIIMFIVRNHIPDFLLLVLIILIIIGYVLLIPVAKLSFVDIRYL